VSDLVVVGSVNADLVVTVRSLPAAGETVSGGTFERHHGGKSANQAVAAARLGAGVAFVAPSAQTTSAIRRSPPSRARASTARACCGSRTRRPAWR
jgi:sugar/nucleoside kinase (ribokinase family)